NRGSRSVELALVARENRAIEVLERPRCRRSALVLVAGLVLRRAVGLLRRRGQPEEAELADLHAGPQLDRQGRDVAEVQRDVARETRVDESRGGMGEEAQATQGTLALETGGHVIRKRHGLVGGAEHEL